MRALTAAVLEDDITTGLLMASADGRALYAVRESDEGDVWMMTMQGSEL